MLEENTTVDAETVTVEKFHEIVASVAKNPLLTPKEANQLTFHITELLLTHNCTSQLLRLLARYLSQTSYDDIIEERIIEHYCGYPLCQYNNSDKIKDIEINKLVKKLRMPRYYNSKFCSKNHYLCSEFYKSQLGKDALFMRINLNKPWFSEGSVENEIILLDEYIHIKEKGTEILDLSNVIQMLRELNVNDSSSKVKTAELIEKFESFKVIEHTGEQKSSEIYQNQ
jgi:hypothetical protein